MTSHFIGNNWLHGNTGFQSQANLSFPLIQNTNIQSLLYEKTSHTVWYIGITTVLWKCFKTRKHKSLLFAWGSHIFYKIKQTQATMYFPQRTQRRSFRILYFILRYGNLHQLRHYTQFWVSSHFLFFKKRQIYDIVRNYCYIFKKSAKCYSNGINK